MKTGGGSDMKPFWKSKTLWVNLGAAAIIIAEFLGEAFLIPVEAQMVILAAINVVLRKVTREPITFGLAEPEDLTHI